MKKISLQSKMKIQKQTPEGKRKKKFIDFTMEKDSYEESHKDQPDYFYPDRLCDLSDYELRVVKLNDDDDTVIETVFTKFPLLASDYLRRYVSVEHRKRRSPNLVSISFSASVVDVPSWRSQWKPIKEPITAATLCFGGTHCFIYDTDRNCCYYRDELVRECPFRELMEDKRNTFIGIGMREFKKKAKEQWDCHVVNAVDLRVLVGEAIGKERAFWWTKKGKALEMVAMELEEMAEAVLDGMRVRKRIKKVRDSEEADDEMLLNSTRDAYLSFEIGRRCFQMIGRKI